MVLRGLESLAKLKQIYIQQHFVMFKRGSNFTVFDHSGNVLYKISGESGVFTKDKKMHVLNTSGNGIICTRDFTNWNTTVTSSVNGHVLGTVVRDNPCSNLRYAILDPKGRTVFYVSGSEGCCSNTNFHVVSQDGHEVGGITKVFNGAAMMTKTNDQYVVSFPSDLAVEMKAVLMAAAIMIDIQFSRTDGNAHDGGRW